jgi:hypothetical protein
MKRLVTILAACMFATLAQGQTTIPDTTIRAPDSMVSFNISLADACAYAATVGDAAVIRAIVRKFDGVTDTAISRNVKVRQRDIVQLARLSNSQPGAAWAARTARMRVKVMAMLPTRPWLAAQIISIQQADAKQDSSLRSRGAAIIRRNQEYDAAQ